MSDWNFRFEDKPPLFPSAALKYQAVIDNVIKLEEGKWLVIAGFADIEELDKMQAAMGGGSGARRAAARDGFKLQTRRYLKDDTIELWIRKVRKL